MQSVKCGFFETSFLQKSSGTSFSAGDEKDDHDQEQEPFSEEIVKVTKKGLMKAPYSSGKTRVDAREGKSQAVSNALKP